MRLISIYRHGKNTKILMSGNHPPVEQGRLHNPMNIKKKKMKTKPHIVDSYTHANAQKNIWQDPHSASYFPGAPADPPPDATLHAPWEADLNEQHQGGARLPAGGERCSRRTKEWKRMRSDCLFSQFPLYGVSKHWPHPTGHSSFSRCPQLSLSRFQKGEKGFLVLLVLVLCYGFWVSFPQLCVLSLY